MEQKIEFINEWRAGRFTISEIARNLNISRLTAYKWIDSYKNEGLPGLEEKGREPKTHPLKTSEEIENRIVLYSEK